MDPHSLQMIAAAEGPHLRAAASAAAEGLFDGLSEPRAVVLVTNESRARLAAEAVVALASDARAPITVARSLPRFVGALDLVFVLTDDPGDPVAEVLVEADRRGAATVLVDPGEGPVRAAASPRTIVVPRPALTVRGSFCGYLGVVLGALTAARVTALGPAAVLSDVADAVDDEAVRCSADRDLLVNPARQWAEWMRGHAVVFAGEGDVWRTVAELAAAWLLDAGVPAHGTTVADVLRASPALSAGQSADATDIFHDPLIDGPADNGRVLPLSVIAVTSPADAPAVRARLEPIEWARVECPAEEAEVRHPMVDVCVTAARVAAAAAHVPEEE
ncbi:hypothetical protein [uncultured Corynebacterium sp.]|uniref:hypothetical protein n=1 Tax=uncultured Corynebacterium sp. TaxID=159447 RepID=UPI0025E1C4DD|nr:hypothetical protein [uncultured Corynebacterium sp.]